MIIRVLKKTLLLALIAVLASSCSEDLNNRYCEYTARFYVDNVSSYPVLATACNSLGEFCIVRDPTSGPIIVSNNKLTSYIERTVLTKYTGGLILGVGQGLIIGKPSLAEIGQVESQVTCYDLCCPNCYDEISVTRQMTLGKNNDAVTCSRCGRSYDLNNMGMVLSGTAGRSLFRYPVSYTGSTLRVSNR